MTFAWTVVATIVAVRQSLDYETTFRAIMVILISSALVYILNFGVDYYLDYYLSLASSA